MLVAYSILKSCVNVWSSNLHAKVLTVRPQKVTFFRHRVAEDKIMIEYVQCGSPYEKGRLLQKPRVDRDTLDAWCLISGIRLPELAMVSSCCLSHLCWGPL